MRVFLVILFLLINCKGVASTIDSLKKVLAHTSGKNEQAIILLQIVKDYLITQDGPDMSRFDSGLSYAANAYALAKEAGNDTLMMQAICRMGDGWTSKEMYEKSVSYYDSALRYAVRMNDKERQVIYIKRKGAGLRSLNRFYEAIEHYKEGITLARIINDKASEGFFYRVISKAYASVEDYVISFEMAQRSIYLCDSLKDYDNLVNMYTSVGSMFVEQKKFPDALKYYFTADSILQKHKIEGQWWVQNKQNIAVCYSRMGNYDKAIALQKQCIEYYAAHGKNIRRIMVAFKNAGDAYSGKGDYAEADKYFQQARKINDSLFDDPVFSFENYIAIAQMNLKAKQPDRALRYALLAGQIANEGHFSMKERMVCAQLLSDIYAEKGDYANARKYDREYEKLQDSVFKKRQSERTAEAETRFKLSEKNKELAVLAKENELHRVERRELVVIIGLGCLLVIVGAGGYRRSIRKNRQLRKQKQIIDEQLAQLAMASEAKSKFYANISHELRTPVTLLTGMLEMMKIKGAGNEKEKLDVAYGSSKKLQSMIEEILNLSRMEQHATGLKKETVAIAPLLKRIAFTFESFIHKKALRLEYSDEAVQGVFISVDEDKFEKIINNLVFNAIKFNRENGTIGVKAYLSADKGHAIVEVSDTGKGINEQDLPHIFERFYQSASSGKQADGLGIGLSLVKEFTELLGGTVSVRSKAGEGSFFTLQFPIAAPEPQTEAVTEETMAPPTEHWEQFGDRQTVLVVEDNTEMRYYLKEVLGAQVNIAEAGNGREALACLAENTPDLIITDIMMPEMDGHEFIEQLKGSDVYKRIPVITLTALADSVNQLKMLRMGVDDYIVKPFNADELRIRVYNLLQNQAARREFNKLPAEPDDIQPGSKEAEEFRQKITDYVLARLKTHNVSVPDLAYELAVSERQLHRLSKALAGCTPAQLMKEVKLQKAYELLLSGDIYKVEDVAHRVGFERGSYFSAQFFERFGKRPTEFL